MKNCCKNDHKLSSLKQHKYIILWFYVSKFLSQSHCAKTKMSQDCYFWRFRRESVSLPFHLPWLVVFLHPQSQRYSSFRSHFHSAFVVILPSLTLILWPLSSVQFSSSVMSNSLQPHGLKHARPPCPSPTPGVYSNKCLLSQWCHPTISSSVIPFSSCLQSFSASESIPLSQFFTSGGQSIGVLASTSVLPMNIQDWCPLEWTGWISLQSKGLSRVFSNTTVQKHQLFGTQLSL